MGNFLERAWYQQALWLKLFRPLSIMFTYLVKRRRRLTIAKDAAYHASVPLIVVGNITVGGTGKTPVTLALIEMLRSQGYRPGVVSRGYGGRPPHYPWCVETHQSPSFAGDEPLLIRSRAHVPVVIDPDRPSAVAHLLSINDCDVVISDDGLQHYALARDVEIAVVDGIRGLGNQRCLPEGPLREPPERLDQVDYILQNGGTCLQHSNADVFTLAATQIARLNSDEHYSVNEWLDLFGVRTVHAVCGIGHPERFYQTLVSLGLSVIQHSFADHHAYTQNDFLDLADHPVLMTEKDAVKCTGFELSECWVLQVSAELPDRFQKSLLQRLAAFQLIEGNCNG